MTLTEAGFPSSGTQGPRVQHSCHAKTVESISNSKKVLKVICAEVNGISFRIR